MRDILQYFDLIARQIDRSQPESAELDIEQIDHRRGTIEGSIFFADGSRLEFTERIVIEQSRPQKRDYRYQYVRDQKAVFRYDNAPHHPRLINFPHHKHVGRKTESATEPTLEKVFKEVSLFIEKTSVQAGPVPARKSRQKNKSKTKR